LSRTFSILTSIFFIFLAIAILGGMVWGNSLYARDHPGEKDFLVPWLAAQTFLQYGDPTDPERITPYSDPAAQRAQIVYYRHLATEAEDPLLLWVPFPAELLYFPFALIHDYALARGLWMTLCEIALVAAASLSLRLTGWKPSRLLFPVALLFPALWIFGFMDILASSATPFVVLAVVGMLLFLRADQDELAGLLLVLPLLKFGIFSVFVLFMIWWAIYHHRGRILAGLGMALGILLLLSFLLQPDWVMPFVRGLYWHINYNPGLSTYRALGAIFPVAGPRFAIVLTGLVLVLIFVEWRDVRQRDFRHMLWTACQALAVAPLLGLPLALTDFAALTVPLFLFLAILNERWHGRRLRGPAGIVLLVTLTVLWALALSAGLALLLPALLLVGLYWMKWWAVRPPRTPLELSQ
jgi:hypothetical protein